MIDSARAEVHVVIRSPDGQSAVVSLVWERGGLGVHETPRLRSEARVIWSVTHVLSGLALVRAARSCELAIEIAEALLQLTDWQQSADAIRYEFGLAARVRDVLGRYR